MKTVNGATKLSVVVTTLISFSPATSHAGPWVKEAGDGYIKAGTSFFSGRTPPGSHADLEYTAVTASIYGEVGLSNRLQGVFNLPYVFGTNMASDGMVFDNPTFGDLTVQLDYGPMADVPLALSLEVKAPLYKTVDPTEAKRPDAGDGNIDITPKIQYGYAFHAFPGWLTTEFGYMHRRGRFVDGALASVSLGSFIVRDHLAIGTYARTLKNLQDDPENHTQEYVYVQGYILLMPGPVLNGASLQLSVGNNTPLSGESGGGADVGVGLSYTF